MNYPLRVRGLRAALHNLSRHSVSVLAAFVFALFVAVPAAFAQSTTGTIEGRVLNASNGMYLNKARIVVEGTAIDTFTNDFGEYRLTNVPAGTIKLIATYTGQEPATATVSVEAGKTAKQDLQFGQATVSEDGVIRLDPYVVATERFKNAQEIAINEERFSVNIKNVVATDAFGDIPSGNIGEFVKFMPGILIDYGASGGAGQGTADADATGISVRGFGAEDTAILIDGMPAANAFPGTMSRQSYLDTLSINNASRVEVIKVATPDMPAKSIGGQVNLVSRSAFEYAKPSFNWSAYITGNSEHLSTKETPGPVFESRKLEPAFTMSAAFPFSPKFGMSVSASFVPEFKVNQRAQPSTWTQDASPSSGTLAPLTPEQVIALLEPIYKTQRLERWQITDTPQHTERRSANVKFDWKPFPGHFLSVNVQGSTYDSVEGQRRLDYRTGVAQSYSATETIGQFNNATPRVAMTVTTRDRTGDSKSASLNYKMQRGGWDVAIAASRSESGSEYRDDVNGHFSEVAAITGGGGTQAARIQVNFREIQDGNPGKIEVLSNGGAGAALDTSKLSAWRFDGGVTAKSGESFASDENGLYKIDVKRELDFIPFADRLNLSLKVGVRRDEQKKEKWGRGSGYAEELITGKTVSFADVVDDRYINQSPGFGQPAQQWISSYKLFALDKLQNLFDVVTEGQKISNYNSFVGQQRSIKETTDAWYAMIEGRALNNRLSFVGGVRQEKQSRVGVGPFTDNRYNFVKNLDGTVFRDNAVITVSGVNYTPYVNGVNFGNSGNITVPRADGTGTGSIPNPFFTTSDGGVRARMTTAGLWFPTNADGTPRVLNNTTLEGRMLQLRTRPVDQESQGDPSFSFAASYDITKKLVGKLSWSRAMGQPPLEDVAGSPGLLSGNGQFTFDEFATPDAEGYIGNIKVANPALTPQISNNWDAALSYYFESGAKVSVSYYWKVVENQISTFKLNRTSPIFDEVLTGIGLDPAEYELFSLSTSTNSSGTQKTSGFEIEVQQNLGMLGSWGKHFNMFASFTKKNLGNPVAPIPITIELPNGTTTTINPSATRTIQRTADTFAGGGIQFSAKRFSASMRGTYRERTQRPGTGTTVIGYTPTGSTVSVPLNYIRTYDPAETRIDASLDYRISNRFSVFATGKDIFNNKRDQYREDDLGWIPEYAKYTDHRSFGIEVTLGVRGSF